MKNWPLHERVGFAICGLIAGWRRERSFRTHVVFAVLALAALLVLRPAPVWWALVLLVAVIVMILELVNSAIEGIIDLLHPGIHAEIKVVKDMMAGAVLLASGAAIVIAAALVVDRLEFLFRLLEGVR